MAVNYDAFKAYNRFDKEIEISLAKPNKQIIGKINEAYNIKQVLKLGQINEITFNIPYQIEKNSIIKQNKHVDMIKQRYLLKVNYLNKEEWYVIAAESDSLNDTNVKQVTAYSLGYQLADKMIKVWPGVEIDGEYRKESLNAFQLLENLLSESSWNLDALRMNLSFLEMYRTFDFANTTILDAVFTVAEKFNAVVSWDTHNKLLYLIDAEKYGTFRGLQISDNRYLRSYEKVTKSDEMATRLKVYGQDGLSINEVNPTGTDFIEDYSFFMRGFKIENNVVVSSSPYMSDGLCKAIIAYQEFTGSLSGLFTSYLEEKETLEQQKIVKDNELVTLKAELFSIETSIDFKESLSEDSAAEKLAEANKKIEIANKEQEILSIKVLIQDVIVLIAGLTNQLSMRENFTVAQREELDNFIIVKTWENENISNPTELLDLAKKELVKLNRPSIVYNISLVYLLKLAEMETVGTRLRLGDKIRVVKKEFNETIESQIIEITINYQSEDIDLVIADSNNLTDEEALAKLLYKSISSSSTLELNKNKWNDISRVDSLVTYVLENKWDSAKREILAGANESVTINNRGITATDSTDPDRFIRITHGVIGMTDDGGNTFKLAIDSTGVYAERLVGRIIVGENLYLENTGGTFRFNQDGVTIQGNALRILAADDTNLIDKWNAAEANAKAYSDSMKLQIQQEIDEIQLTLDDFDLGILDAFADGIISEAESISIGNYKNSLNTEKADIELRFQSVYNNVQLTGEPKTALDTKKIAYDSAHTNLLETIDIAIEDKKTTLQEKADVDNMFSLYRTALSELSVAFEDAIDAIAQAKATLAKENALEASVKLGQTINGVKIDTSEGLVVTRGDDKVKAVFNATEGIKISTKSANDTWKDTFKYDTAKQLLVIEGEINAQDLKIKGEPVLTNNGKIAVAAIENLEVGTNVVMGPNATITWSQLDNTAKDNITANQMVWLGSFDSYPDSPTKNDGFYHTIEKKSYIFDGSIWNVLAQDGSHGGGAITAVLSNDSHVLPANSEGQVTTFEGCETTFYVYEGATNVTSAWLVDVVATNLTYQTDNSRYIITGISQDIGYLDFTFTRVGYPTLTKRFTVSKVEKGADGITHTAYWLVNSSPVVAKSATGQYTPSTLQVSSMSRSGFMLFPYGARYTIDISEDGINYINQYTSAIDQWNASLPLVLPNIKTIRVRMYQAGGTDTLLDEQIIPIVSDGLTGASGVTALLSNDSHVLGADSSGNVLSYAGCSTTVSVYEGAADKTNTWTATVTATNLTYTTSGKTYSIIGISADIGYLDIVLTKSGHDTITKRFTVTKTKDGEDGLSGENSISYWLVNSASAIAKNNLGAYTPSSITITSKTQSGADTPTNYAGRFIISTSTNGTSYTIKYTSSANESSVLYNPEVNIKTIKVQMYLAGGTTTLVDEQIIPIISDGIDGTSAITAVLTNDSHVLNADSNGNVSSYAGCNTTVYVYQGATDMSNSWTATVTATNLTYTTSGKTYTITGASADMGYLDITLTRSGYSSITKRFTVTKAKQGAQGSPGTTATSYWLVNSTPAIGKSASGVYNPTSLTVTGKSQTSTDTPTDYSGRFIIATSLDGTTYTTQYTSTSNESSKTYSVNLANIKTIKVQMFLAGGTSTLLDEQIIPIVADGANGNNGADGVSAITSLLSNDSHVVYADSSGFVTSFAGCNTTAYVYQGITDVSSSWSATVAATNLTFTTSGKTYTVTGISADTGYLDITLTRSGYASIVKRFTVTKAKQGTQGSNATAYWLVNSVPAIAKGISGAYTPSTITITGKTQSGTNAPTNYSGRFIIATSTDGTTYTTQYTSSSDEASTTYSVNISNIKTIRVQMYLAGGTILLLDEQIIPIVSDGQTGSPGPTGSQGPQGLPGQYYAPGYLYSNYIGQTEIRSPTFIGNAFIGSNDQVGMSSNGTSTASVRFWAGTTYVNSWNAPFKVLQDGTVSMSRVTLNTAYTADNEYMTIDGSIVAGYKYGVGNLFQIRPYSQLFTTPMNYGGALQLYSYQSNPSLKVRELVIQSNSIQYLNKSPLNNNSNIGSHFFIGGTITQSTSAVVIRKGASEILTPSAIASTLYVDGRATITGGYTTTAGSENLGYGALQTYNLTVSPTSFEESFHNVFAEEGTIMYDQDTKNLKFYDGTEWKTILAN